MITEEQIWSYLDGQLNEAGRLAIDLELGHDTDAKRLFDEISALNMSLKSDVLILSPSVSFTDKVMAAIQITPASAPRATFSFIPFLIVALPIILVLAVFAGCLAYYHVPLTYSIPVNLPDFKNFQLYFMLADVLLLAYFIEWTSEYRLNRKTFFAQ